MSARQILISSFLDGISAPLHIFDKVPLPGSHSAELADLTTPEMLAAYGKVDPSIPGFLLEMREKELKRDAKYSMSVRINGYLGLATMMSAAVVLILKG